MDFSFLTQPCRNTRTYLLTYLLCPYFSARASEVRRLFPRRWSTGVECSIGDIRNKTLTVLRVRCFRHSFASYYAAYHQNYESVVIGKIYFPWKFTYSSRWIYLLFRESIYSCINSGMNIHRMRQILPHETNSSLFSFISIQYWFQ